MNIYPLLKPLLMHMDAERAHRLTVRALKMGIGPRCAVKNDRLQTECFGITFPSPIGMAAGFDKDAEVLPALFNVGFGFVEAGTVTPRPQEGNLRPRIFRDKKSESVINRMGFPGAGLDIFEQRLKEFRAKYPDKVIGANIGINKDETDSIAAYVTGYERLAPLADYIAVNISSPNTKGLRDLQQKDQLDSLLQGLMAVRGDTPLLVKIAPDLNQEQKHHIAHLAQKYKIDGLIVSNTTIARPDVLPPDLRSRPGGLSGKLLTAVSTALIADIYALTGGEIPIIGVGGVSSAEDAYRKIRAGASLVQLYTALVYQGPGLIARILKELPLLLEKDGFKSITEAVGTGHEQLKNVS